MASEAISSQGTVISVSTDEGLTYIDVAEVVSFSGPDGTTNEIDVTHLGSDAKEYLLGLPDEGNFTFDVNFIPANASQQTVQGLRMSRERADWRVTFADTDNTEIDFEAFVSGFSIEGEQDDKLSGSVTLRITGPVTGPWSA